jgi:hypothetical protein
MLAMRNWRTWVGAVIIVYGLFLMLVGLTTRPANAGVTVLVVLMGAAIAGVGGLFAWRSVRRRAR